MANTKKTGAAKQSNSSNAKTQRARPQQNTKKAEIKKANKVRTVLLVVCAVLVLAVVVYDIYNPGFIDAIYTSIYSNDVTIQTVGDAQDINSKAKIHFIDVGQGDCILIEQNSHYAMIDASEKDSENDILEYLNSLNITKLDILIMTHPHSDHIGAMRSVINQVDVDLMILPDLTKGQTSTTITFQKLLQTLADKGIPTQTAKEGDVYPLGKGNITVLISGADKPDNLNDVSIATMFQIEDFKFISTGDGEKQMEEDLLSRGYDLSADIYKAAHHGSSTSNTLDFLKAISPKAIVVSCGLDNKYGHPHAEILENAAEMEVPIYRTDLNGNVVVCVTDNGINIVCEKESPVDAKNKQEAA